MKSIFAIIALATVLAAVGLYNMPTGEPDDTVSFSYCNPGGKPLVFDLASVHSLAPIKHKQKNTLVLTGKILKSVFIHEAVVSAKISAFKKDITQVVDKQTVVGPFNNQIPVDLSKEPLKGKCNLKIEYKDKAGNVLSCTNYVF